jgi:hypothetical protein
VTAASRPRRGDRRRREIGDRTTREYWTTRVCCPDLLIPAVPGHVSGSSWSGQARVCMSPGDLRQRVLRLGQHPADAATTPSTLSTIATIYDHEGHLLVTGFALPMLPRDDRSSL